MTLIISLANADQIIQLSDRRLTRAGKLFDDSTNKAGHVLCDDASFVFSFTGLAKVSSRHSSTTRWLLEAFYDCLQGHHGYAAMVPKFADYAAQHFRMAPAVTGLPPSDRRLTVMMTG